MMCSLLLLTALAGPAADDDAQPAPATITVKLPAAAKLFVNDTAVSQKGTTRSFKTPSSLRPERVYHYTLRATVERDGETVSVSRKIDLRAGKETTVDFGDLRLAGDADGPPLVGSTAPAPNDDPAKALGLPEGIAPHLLVVRAEGDKVYVTQLIPETEERVKKEKRKDKDGKEVEVDVKYTITVVRPVAVPMPAKFVRLMTAQGQALDEKALAERLKDWTVVLNTFDPRRVGPAYRAAFKPDALECWQNTQNFEGDSVGSEDSQVPARNAPPQFKPAPVKQPSPSTALARIDARGNLRIRVGNANREENTGQTKLVEDGKERLVQFAFRTSHLTQSATTVPAIAYRAVDSTGKAIAENDLRRMLEKETVVVVAGNYEKPDDLYLSIVKPGVPVIISAVPLHGSWGYGHGGVGAGETIEAPALPAPKPEN